MVTIMLRTLLTGQILLNQRVHKNSNFDFFFFQFDYMKNSLKKNNRKNDCCDGHYRRRNWESKCR